MKNKLFLLFLLALYLGLSSCGKRTKATVSFINDLKEESKTQAKDGSYIYSHFLNVGVVSLKNERKLKKTDTVANLKLYHLSGFKKLIENADDIKYRVFAGDSSETVFHQKDSALLVLMGVNATITDQVGNKLVDIKDINIPTQIVTSKFPAGTDSKNVNGKCISVSEHITSVVTNENNIYYKNMNIVILSNPLVFTKEQKYKLHFRVYDKLDPNRYFEGETLFTVY